MISDNVLQLQFSKLNKRPIIDLKSFDETFNSYNNFTSHLKQYLIFFNQRLAFQSLLHCGVREDATAFPGLLHFTLDPYVIMLSAKHGEIKYYF